MIIMIIIRSICMYSVYIYIYVQTYIVPPSRWTSCRPASSSPRLGSSHAILYYTILYYTILYYTILYYTILYYTIIICCVFVICHTIIIRVEWLYFKIHQRRVQWKQGVVVYTIL